MVRKTIFWLHLMSGVAASLVILMMSVTGVLLTYERQMLHAAERAQYVPPPEGAQRLPVAALLAAAKLAAPELTPTSLTYDAEAGAPVTLAAGRSGSVRIDAYTGELRPEAAPRMAAFFDAMTGWHRWFNATGDSRGLARAITGASNLAFLFLIVSGMYLWLPRLYRWAAFKARLTFNARYSNSKARDFNWHHVIGIWTAVPLVVVVATATVFSYGWANDLVYLSVGEPPPSRTRGAAPPQGARAAPLVAPTEAAQQASASEALSGRGSHAASRPPLGLDALLENAIAFAGDDWQRITLNLPQAEHHYVGFRIDRGNGGQPQHRHDIVLDTRSGALTESKPFQTLSAGQRLRSIVRYLHTGEVLGLPGQTIAGLVSLTSVLMVWTGLALAYRRLVAPLFRRRSR